MKINYWADHKPRPHRLHQTQTVPSPFAFDNRQFYATVDPDFDAGAAEIAPGVVVGRDREPDVRVALTGQRSQDMASDREF